MIGCAWRGIQLYILIGQCLRSLHLGIAEHVTLTIVE